jgi:hypothetical protein
MPDVGASRKRQIPVRRIPGDLAGSCGDHATNPFKLGGIGPHRRSLSDGLGVKSAAVIRIRNGTVRRAASLYMYYARWRPICAATAPAAAPRPEPELSLIEGFGHSIRRKPFASETEPRVWHARTPIRTPN